MASRILITGGAGFIGAHLADTLLRAGRRVRVLDSLCEQVHGPGQRRPGHLDPDVELMVGDVGDPEAVRLALVNVDAVVHLAAAVGVGQSMYQIARYLDVNATRTGVLLEALAARPVGRLVVASSMSVYGEGLYRTLDGELVAGEERPIDQLRRGQWELQDAVGRPLAPVPTPESKAPSLSSVYALSKFAQEQLGLVVGRAHGTPTVILRLFNVYGPRQAFSNPYTGVLAIVAARLLNGRPPLIFEDGRQSRDFVSVHDVARACQVALEHPEAPGRVFNVGSGAAHTVLEVASLLARAMGRVALEPVITGRYRAGDIRHCFADVERLRRDLGFAARVPLAEGLEELVAWLDGPAAKDRGERAPAEVETGGGSRRGRPAGAESIGPARDRAARESSEG